MNTRLCLAAAILLAVLPACERADSGMQLEPVALPSAGETMAPQLFNVDGRVSLSWMERRGPAWALRYATWTGEGWSEAREVARGKNWFANWADLPGVRPLEQGGWVAWWLQKSAPATYAYDVQLAFSKDGIEWQRRGTPHSDGTPTEHGFVTAFDLSTGGLGLAWLDGRNTASGDSEGGHGVHGAGGMTLRYGLFDADRELVKEAELDALACDCCQTDSAATDDGIVVVYRDRTKGEIRDINAVRYANGEWSEPVRVHADGWKIDGCPVNGPAVAAIGDRVGVAWFTAAEGKGEVRFAWSHDGGRTFGEPRRIDDGRPQGRVDLVMHPEHGAFASWVELSANGAEVRLRRIGADDAGASRAVTGTDAGRAAGFPRMTVLEDGRVLMAWTSTDGKAREVRTATVSP